MGCQLASDREKDATLVPTWAISSQTVIPPNTRGGVLKGASLKPAGGCSAVRCLFRERPRGGEGGVRSLPLGSYCCKAGQALGMKQPMVIVCLVTISSSPGSDSASEELTDSAAAGLAI